MIRFTIPREVYFGDDALKHLKTVKAKKAMLVIGSRRLVEDGTIPKIRTILEEAGIVSAVFSGVEADPSIATVRKGVEAFNAFQPDLIIGVGGGSPIDAAKAMWIFYEHPDLTFEEAAKPFSLPELRQKAKFIAIPTTSGTGTEVTSFSVITDHETGIKYPIADYNITPDIAIVDTSLVAGMTKELVANTGMDALTHAIEAYVSKASNPVTDALAMKAIEMCVENVAASYHGNSQARGEMHIAQCIAGMAFSNAILGIVHSMAHKSGKAADIPHGCANAIYLTYVIQYNAKEDCTRFAEIARRLGLAGANDADLTKSLVDCIKQLRVEMNMPASLKEYGVPEKEFMDTIDQISAAAVDDPCTGTNPRPITVPQMKRLFEAVYYGNDVEF